MLMNVKEKNEFRGGIEGVGGSISRFRLRNVLFLLGIARVPFWATAIGGMDLRTVQWG
jgi:hypothetical protein